MHRRRVILSVAAVVSLLGLTLAATGPAQAATDFSKVGRFEAPLSANGDFDAAPPATIKESTRYPTAVTSAFLPVSGKVAYWNGLENLEADPFPLAADAPYVAYNSRSRVMSLSDIEHPVVPTPEGGGSTDMFCADVRITLDGKAFVVGGTVWKFDPVANPLADATPAGHLPGGTAELFGATSARLLSANGTQWTQTESMHRGRWYPAMVTLPDGKLFVAGGVGRLIYNAPIFQNGNRADGADGHQASGTNIEQSETYDPYVGGAYKPENGKWILNDSDTTTFPLFPRLHLLPNGKVFYDGVGQMWGPFGQGFDEALWNNMKVYDPATRAWSDAGVGSYGALNGAVSVVLPIKPDASGNYSDSIDILHAGGTLGTSPGLYLATPLAEIVTVGGNGMATAARLDSQLNNRRWYSSAALGPDGKVYIFSGADKDEVVAPGQERAVRQAESYDPATKTFAPLAFATRDRTYHNSVILMPDGRFLVGGHSPINNLYGPGSDDANSEHAVTGLVEAATGLPVGTANNLKDPSFQIFTPPYLLNADGSPKARPQLNQNSGIPLYAWGSTRNIATTGTTKGTDVKRAVLIHVPATTHITDADAREIDLKISNAGTGSFDVAIPSSSGITPPGFYYLFAIDANGTPSVANIVRVGDTTVFNGTAAVIPNVKAPASAPASKSVSTAKPAQLVAEPATSVRIARRASGSKTPIAAMTLIAAAAMAIAFGSVRRARKATQ